ncbi:hypothetical protein [Sediminicola luteus]|uniref:Uncharacterized protein n=1 Tax=Sediminicola luteus TaxID=319238 RepID=A0A2A4G582_9FLAO|nr:hypothetical protein [Sediminicola luteus]PCE62895.1 hypothetical protein B7P33_16600 [Sediminicola luteus]
MKREIDFIKPKYIISQGNAVGNFIDRNVLIEPWKNIQEKKRSEFHTALPKGCKTTPRFIKYQSNMTKIIHVRLPHVASGNSKYFWTPAQKEVRKVRLEGIRNELESFVK